MMAITSLKMSSTAKDLANRAILTVNRARDQGANECSELKNGKVLDRFWITTQ
jgi:hypothetical protein